MRIIDVKQGFQNGRIISGFVLLMAIIILALLLVGSAKETEKIQAVRQMPMSYSERDGEEFAERKVIIIHVPGLPKEAKKLEMVLIKPGTFMMGSSKAERGRKGYEWPWPPHEVTITKPFYMGKYEVTQAQWEAMMGHNRSYFRGRPNSPVEKVTWRACQKFIKRLNALGQGTFRLPTEAEWEFACRAGTETQFSFGDSIDIADKYMWWRGNNDTNETKEVGLKSPNPWGLYDMHGNVLEWCADRWELSTEREPQIDPQGPSKGLSFFFLFTNRVLRGGAFASSAQDCRSSFRGREQSIDFHLSLGFRLVREYP